jgi:hypothetical protein
MNDRKLAIVEQGQNAPTRAMTAVDMRAQVNLVQEVMQAVMKKDTHYGVIPGTKKPSLYKPGAEVLAATFRIAVSYRVDDLSTDDHVRYRVTAIGTHQTSGIVLGEGMGECSSGEEKYKWRRAICDEEYDLTPENRRRIKFGKYQGKVEKTKQVRTEPADQANTILKMACKRAQVAMTLNVTAASDIFTQDIEDLPEELRTDDGTGEPRAEPARTGPTPYPDDKLTAMLPAYTNLVQDGAKTPDDIIKTIKSKYTLTDEQEKKIRALAKQPSRPDDNKKWLDEYDKKQGEQQ